MAANLPEQSPLFHAQQADRYDRQGLIVEYGQRFDCKLIVMIDVMFPDSVTSFEELIYDASPDQDLHLLLNSPGGDGETAIRLVRSAQARCKELTVIVPDQAKSAATLFAIGAHSILLGPSSDLGPVDPQFRLPDGSLASAKDIIAAVDDATRKVQAAPNTYPIYASLLADLTALKVQQARSALARTTDQVEEALKSHTGRSAAKVKSLKQKLRGPLIQRPKSHTAIFGAKDALAAGLPVIEADPASEQWQSIWRLWTKYVALNPMRVYEGQKSSIIEPWP